MMFDANMYNVDGRYNTEVGSYATDRLALDALSTFTLMALPDVVHMLIVKQPFGFDVYNVKCKKTTRKDFCPVRYIHLYRAYIREGTKTCTIYSSFSLMEKHC